MISDTKDDISVMKKVLKAARYFNIKVAELGANICAHI